MKKKNKKKSTNLFIKLPKQKFNSMLNKIFKSLKIFKKLNLLKNKATINLHLIFAVFQGMSKNQNKLRIFIGENHNILPQINFKT